MRMPDLHIEPSTAPAPGTSRAARLKPAGHRLDDESLARRLADRQDSAFGTLYERYHQPLYRYCRSLLHDDGDAQDALQSAFTLALVALREGRRDAPLRPWLFRIAHNEAISLVRRRRVGDQELSEALLPTVPSAADEAAERARLALLISDLTHLPDRQRGALLMRELSGLSHADIAVALGTSTAAAKQAIFEARQALSEFAEGRTASCEEIRRRLSERDGRMLRSRRLRSHLRDCSTCDAFAAAIGQRRSDLRAIAPALPVVASVGLLARLVRGAGGGGGDHGLSGLAAGGAAAAAAGKFGGAALISKTIATIAAALTTVAGVAGLGMTRDPSHAARGPQAATVSRAIAAAGHGPGPGSYRRPSASAHGQGPNFTAGGVNRAATKTEAAVQPATKTGSAGASVSGGSPTPGKPVNRAQTSNPTPSSPANFTQNPTSSATSTPTSQSASSPANSGSAPGHRATSPGNSGAAPGHNKVAAAPTGGSPGNSGAAPGHTAAAPGQGATSPGNSAAAPGHNKVAAAPAGSSAGDSGAAPGHNRVAAAPGATSPGSSGAAPGHTKAAAE